MISIIFHLLTYTVLQSIISSSTYGNPINNPRADEDNETDENFIDEKVEVNENHKIKLASQENKSTDKIDNGNLGTGIVIEREGTDYMNKDFYTEHFEYDIQKRTSETRLISEEISKERDGPLTRTKYGSDFDLNFHDSLNDKETVTAEHAAKHNILKTEDIGTENNRTSKFAKKNKSYQSTIELERKHGSKGNNTYIPLTDNSEENLDNKIVPNDNLINPMQNSIQIYVNKNPTNIHDIKNISKNERNIELENRRTLNGCRAMFGDITKEECTDLQKKLGISKNQLINFNSMDVKQHSKREVPQTNLLQMIPHNLNRIINPCLEKMFPSSVLQPLAIQSGNLISNANNLPGLGMLNIVPNIGIRFQSFPLSGILTNINLQMHLNREYLQLLNSKIKQEQELANIMKLQQMSYLQNLISKLRLPNKQIFTQFPSSFKGFDLEYLKQNQLQPNPILSQTLQYLQGVNQQLKQLQQNINVNDLLGKYNSYQALLVKSKGYPFYIKKLISQSSYPKQNIKQNLSENPYILWIQKLNQLKQQCAFEQLQKYLGLMSNYEFPPTPLSRILELHHNIKREQQDTDQNEFLQSMALEAVSRAVPTHRSGPMQSRIYTTSMNIENKTSNYVPETRSNDFLQIKTANEKDKDNKTNLEKIIIIDNTHLKETPVSLKNNTLYPVQIIEHTNKTSGYAHLGSLETFIESSSNSREDIDVVQVTSQPKTNEGTDKTNKTSVNTPHNITERPAISNRNSKEEDDVVTLTSQPKTNGDIDEAYTNKKSVNSPRNITDISAPSNSHYREDDNELTETGKLRAPEDNGIAGANEILVDTGLTSSTATLTTPSSNSREDNDTTTSLLQFNKTSVIDPQKRTETLAISNNQSGDNISAIPVASQSIKYESDDISNSNKTSIDATLNSTEALDISINMQGEDDGGEQVTSQSQATEDNDISYENISLLNNNTNLEKIIIIDNTHLKESPVSIENNMPYTGQNITNAKITSVADPMNSTERINASRHHPREDNDIVAAESKSKPTENNESIDAPLNSTESLTSLSNNFRGDNEVVPLTSQPQK